MQWLTDSYTVVAGDVAKAWCGRGYNAGVGRWESLMGVAMQATVIRQGIVRSIDLRVFDGVTGGIKDGVFAMVFVVGDGTHTDYVVPVLQGVMSRSKLLCRAFEIGVPMLGGIQWRIMQGGLAVPDRVDIGVGYE